MACFSWCGGNASHLATDNGGPFTASNLSGTFICCECHRFVVDRLN